MNGISEPSIMLGRLVVALERGFIIAGITGKVKRYYRKMLHTQQMDFCFIL